MIAINYEEVIVCGNRKVTRSFYEIVRYQALEGMSLMNKDEPFTAETLCGDGFWSRLRGDGERRLAGGCVAKMVRDGEVPLELAGKKRKHPFVSNQVNACRPAVGMAGR